MSWTTTLLAAAAIAVAAPASAEIWRIDQAQSAITFEYTEDGVAKSGAFEDFSGRGVFDPARPSRATLIIEIETGSVQLEDRVRTSIVSGRAWFDTEGHPEARYELSALDPQADGSYVATGELTIKGVSRTITSPLSIEFGAGSARAVGRIEFDRFDFNVGDRNLFVDIGDDIAVAFDLVATGR